MGTMEWDDNSDDESPLGKYGHLARRVAREFVHPSLLDMAMIHLECPRKRGFLHWDELGCLSRALGFPGDLFDKHVPAEVRAEHKDGLDLQTLEEMVDHYRYLHLPLDRSFNNHTDDWNVSVLHKAIKLLDYKHLSFSELQAVRMAYQLYEAVDTKGMVLGQKRLLRALKLCGLMISPKKMMQRLKHMRNSLEEKNRVQLHEFLDLLLWCEEYENYEVKETNLQSDKDKRELYKVDEFNSVLRHHDQKLSKRLNQQYMKDEWTFTKEKHGSKRIPRDPPIDPEVRKDRVQLDRKVSRTLRQHMGQSQQRVNQAKAGYVRDRPVSAPCQGQQRSVSFVESPTPDEPSRPQSVVEFLDERRPRSRGVSREDIQRDVPRPKLNKYERPKTPKMVTTRDVMQMRKEKDSLKFEMETIEMKYKQLMNEDMDFLMPGYRQRMENMPRPETPPTPEPPAPPKKKLGPTPETLNRLTYQRRRRTPHSHGNVCDARFRGWNKVKTKAGPHFILARPHYDNSPHGDMLGKLHTANMRDLDYLHDDYIYRTTSKKEVVPNSPQRARPKSAATPRSSRASGASPGSTISTNEGGKLGLPQTVDEQLHLEGKQEGCGDTFQMDKWVQSPDSRDTSKLGSSAYSAKNHTFQNGQLGNFHHAELDPIMEASETSSATTSRVSSGPISATSTGHLNVKVTDMDTGSTQRSYGSITPRDSGYYSSVTPQGWTPSSDVSTPSPSPNGDRVYTTICSPMRPSSAQPTRKQHRRVMQRLAGRATSASAEQLARKLVKSTKTLKT